MPMVDIAMLLDLVQWEGAAKFGDFLQMRGSFRNPASNAGRV